MTSFSETSDGPFLGRTEELERLDQLWAKGSRLVTVTGPPGIGKTRFARSHLDRIFADSGSAWGETFFCDLSCATSSADVVMAVATELDFTLSSPDEGLGEAEFLGRALDGLGRVLLLLDNFEQVAEYAQETVGRWLELAPQLCFLVTSRGRLRLRGEVLLELQPLSEAQGTELFVWTAQTVRSDFSVSDAEQKTVETLVRRLDGIPLAIELAASRATVLSPASILERLDQRFQLLRQRGAGLSTRQATLRAALDWSWELLSEDERKVLAQCSVFPVGFSLEAAEAVVSLDSGFVLDVLEDLACNSLLHTRTHEGPGTGLHFRLYESVRAYATEKADEQGLLGPAEELHCSYYLSQAADRIGEFGSPEGDDLDWFEANRDHLVAIHQRFGQRAPASSIRALLALIRRGPFDATVALLDPAIEALDEELPVELRARLYFSRGVGRSGMGRTGEGNEDLQRTLDLARAHGLEALEVKAILHRGLNALRSGQLGEAEDLLSKTEERARAGGHGRLLCRALVSQGMALEARGTFDRAEACYGEALDLARKLGDRWEEARTRSKMGTLCLFVNRWEEARNHLNWSIRHAQEIGDLFIGTCSAYNLGRLELNAADLGAAEQQLQAALEGFVAMGNRNSEAFVRVELGVLHLDRRAFDEARQHLRQADQALGGQGDSLIGGYCQLTLAEVELVAGQLDEARRWHRAGADQVQALDHAVLQGIAHCIAAGIEFQAEDREASQQHRDEARRLLGDSEWGEGRALLAVVEALLGEELDLDAVDDQARARALRTLLPGDEGRPSQDTRSPAPVERPKEVPTDALLVHPDARWFHPPEGNQVDLTRKRTLRPLLLTLVNHRLEEPGKALDVEELFAAVWPGERILPDARKNRVYVAVASLRKLGLDAVLTTRGDGYLLREDIEVVFAG